jgi:DNA-binding CsgD family transcriptional regulator
VIAVERGDDAADELLNDALATLDLVSNHSHAIDIVCIQAERALLTGDIGSAAQRFAEALVRAKVAGDARGRIRPLIGLGDIAGSKLTTDEALHHFREAFEIARDHQDERAIIQILERIAVLGVSSRIIPNLLRMIGLAEALRTRLDVGRSTYDEQRIAPKLHHARQMLGDDEYNRVRAEGETLSLAQALQELEAGVTAMRATSSAATGKGKSAPLTIDHLTRREREVVQQISKGHTNRQIAANLGMAERTVDSHIGNIRQKLQLPSRAQIAVWAVANGLSRPD